MKQDVGTPLRNLLRHHLYQVFKNPPQVPWLSGELFAAVQQRGSISGQWSLYNQTRLSLGCEPKVAVCHSSESDRL